METNDCTVKALMNAFDIPYEIAHSICAKYGRKVGHGFQIQAELMERLPLKVVYVWENPLFDWPNKLWVRNLLGYLETDRTYLVLVNAHIFCIKNGKIINEIDNSYDRVHKIYEVNFEKLARKA